MNPHEYIGERIHAAMWIQRVTQKQVAAALGITQSSIARKLRGERPWSIEDVLTACSLLGLAPADVLPDAGDYAASRDSDPVPAAHG